MDQFREWEQLKFYEPRNVLVELRKIEKTHDLNKFPYDVATLRTRKLRSYGESRQCAIFCYGIGEIFGLNLKYAQYESQDYDYVAVYEKDDYLNYVPIQMKELVPDKINPKANLQTEINKLQKYVDSNNLCVSIYLNKEVRIEFSNLEIPKLNIKELWLFGSKSPDQDDWWLIGNLLETTNFYEFKYPGN